MVQRTTRIPFGLRGGRIMSLNNDYVVAKIVEQRIADLHAEAAATRLAALVRKDRRRRRARSRTASDGAEAPSPTPARSIADDEVDDLADAGHRSAASESLAGKVTVGPPKAERPRHRMPS
jgi:hypothetical protein